MKTMLTILLISYAGLDFAQLSSSHEKDIIMNVLQKQVMAWNDGNIEEFMEGYWKSDSLKFIGKKGLTMGWENTLGNYKKSYPDTKAMGKLEFEFVSTELLSPDAALVIGKWKLIREADQPQGYFSLIMKKIDGYWLIVADHSS